MTNIVDKEKGAIFAEEAFVVDVQSFLHTMMEEKGYSRADLAKAMGVSRARVTQLFSDECKNFTIRLLARAAFAMGETVEVECDFLRNARAKEAKKLRSAAMAKEQSNVVPLWHKSPSFDDASFNGCHADGRLDSFAHLSSMARAA